MPAKLALGAGLVVLFASTVLVLTRVMPGPRKSTDYLVIGTLATFVCIVVVFIVSATGKGGDTFYRRRK